MVLFEFRVLFLGFQLNTCHFQSISRTSFWGTWFFNSRNIVKTLSKQKPESVKFHMHNLCLNNLSSQWEGTCFIVPSCLSFAASWQWNDSILHQLVQSHLKFNVELNNWAFNCRSTHDISQFLITHISLERNKNSLFLLNHSRLTYNKLIDSLAYKDLWFCFFFASPQTCIWKHQIFFCRCLIAFYFFMCLENAITLHACVKRKETKQTLLELNILPWGLRQDFVVPFLKIYSLKQFSVLLSMSDCRKSVCLFNSHHKQRFAVFLLLLSADS